MNEQNPYPGLVVQYNAGYLVMQMIQESNIMLNTKDDGMGEGNLNRLVCVFRKASDGNCTIFRRYNQTGDVLSSSGNIGYSAHDKTLLLGCYQQIDGTKGRYAKGVMHDCIVYDRALSDDEITALLA